MNKRQVIRCIAP